MRCRSRSSAGPRARRARSWEATPFDELALEGRDPGFGHRVVVGVAIGARPRGGAELVEPAGVADARVLGGFNLLSQHLDEEGCDGTGSATCGGSCRAASDAVAGSAVGGTVDVSAAVGVRSFREGGGMLAEGASTYVVLLGTTARTQNGHITNDTRDVSRRNVPACNHAICSRKCVARDRACTHVTPQNLHGKEGVDGSSPSEDLDKVPANWHFSVARP
jgi:hypothetical protein